MTEQYDWILGLKASFQPMSSDQTQEERIVGEIVDIRDDSPWPEEEHCRIVLETEEGLYDVAKERVALE